MCGRYMLTSPVEAIRQTFGVEAGFNLGARYNIAPGQQIPIIRLGKAARELVMAEWGLVPSWMKEKPTSKLMINARAETVTEKPSFRAAFARRRCLIPANGFYEWQKTRHGKIPMLIHLDEGKLFAFAGIWEAWWGPDGDELLETTALLTRPAISKLMPVHDRMPIMLAEADMGLWLGEENIAPGEVLPRLRQRPDDEISFYAVSRLVNNVANDDARLIEEGPETRQGELI
ncbi:MAG: SOS response-associated peptidase [Sphingomonadales bacterium]